MIVPIHEYETLKKLPGYKINELGLSGMYFPDKGLTDRGYLTYLKKNKKEYSGFFKKNEKIMKLVIPFAMNFDEAVNITKIISCYHV